MFSQTLGSLPWLNWEGNLHGVFILLECGLSLLTRRSWHPQSGLPGLHDNTVCEALCFWKFHLLDHVTQGWNGTSPLPPTLSQFLGVKFHKLQRPPCSSSSAIEHATETRLPVMSIGAAGCLSAFSRAGGTGLASLPRCRLAGCLFSEEKENFSLPHEQGSHITRPWAEYMPPSVTFTPLKENVLSAPAGMQLIVLTGWLM